jgi:fumarate hydratase class II
MAKRKERDSMGEISISEDALWGAQTERTRINFSVGTEIVPLNVIYALTRIKKAAAITHRDLKLVSSKKAQAIVEACDEILIGKWNDQFPVSLWQSGSGTQTNMNVNEVVANRAHQLLGGKLTDKNRFIHPNDDVNKSQSTNDTFPAAMHVAAYESLVKNVIPSARFLQKTLEKKAKEFKNDIKVGRTHLMDAVPISFGQEFSGYVAQLAIAIKNIEASIQNLRELPLGGTAVGTGLNAPKKFDALVVARIAKETKLPFVVAKNKFAHISSHEALVIASSSLKTLAIVLTKIANDIRLGASGPHTGFADIEIPANEPGSSIMPGKVNPTQAEMMVMVCAQVLGNDLAVTIGGVNGQFQLNASKPAIIFNILHSAQLLSSAMDSFNKNCVSGIKINKAKAQQNLDRSLMNVTALNTRIGYDTAAEMVKLAKREGKTLREVIIEQKILTAPEYDRLIHYRSMI